MLTFYKLIAIGALIAFCLSTTGIAYYSSQKPNAQANQQADKEQKKEKDNRENKKPNSIWGFLFPDSISVFTFWLVVATTLMAFVAFIQIGFLTRAEQITAQAANAAQQSTIIARDTLTKGSRAFVFPKGLSLLSHLDEKTGKVWWEITPIWENAGNTPTRDLFINVNSYFEPGFVISTGGGIWVSSAELYAFSGTFTLPFRCIIPCHLTVIPDTGAIGTIRFMTDSCNLIV